MSRRRKPRTPATRRTSPLPSSPRPALTSPFPPTRPATGQSRTLQPHATGLALAANHHLTAPLQRGGRVIAEESKSSGAVTGSQLNGDRKVVYDKGGTERVSAGFNDPSQKYQDTPHNFSNQIYTDLLPDFMKDPKHLVYLVSGMHYTEPAGVKTIVTTTDAKHAKVLYAQMTAPGRDAFDKAAGTNHYADPAIGESYNMATGANMPGFKKTSKKTWNFHWAGVVLKDGADNITLENFAVTGEYAKSKGVPQGEFVDRDWNFDMYGTLNKDQTFHKEHLASNTHGNMATSMVVRTNK